ncbi:MAG: Fic family protein [Candidatus Aenigmarchaeota archaeon]|nr:Fic family protein [Candidatus Aenigmarchaeota archaeon]
MVHMRVLKRKKGKKFYFYLQYSFRENGKVVTKEKYLGSELPKNIDMIKEEIEQAQKSRIYSKLRKIKDNFQKEWKTIPESAKEREQKEIAIAFTYNTNAIEGSKITLPETREILNDKIAPKKPLVDVKETESHAKVFLEMLAKREDITRESLLGWHKEIFGETKSDIAGIFRTYLIRVGSYVAPDWQDVKKLMGGFIEFINKSKLNPVELAARAHYRFEKIHPFGDGNGRIGRLLMNHILWHAGYPMLIIEYKKRKSYYKALEKDEGGFVKYFIRKYLSVHKKRLGS